MSKNVESLEKHAGIFGKSHVHKPEAEYMVALTVEAAAMAKVPLAGTDWIPFQQLRR